MAKFVQTLDNEGRNVIRLNRANGKILARWRNDMPGQNGMFQWVRERRAVEAGLGELCWTAIQCALYENGLSDFSPARHCPELGHTYIIK